MNVSFQAARHREPRAPQVLELRIHGIKNTTPAEMLGVSADQVERADGDELGAFWIEKTPPPTAGQQTPRRTRREAYSWGEMARSGGGPLALIGTLFVHLGWLLILPFGLCNVAYWTRRIPTRQRAGRWDGGRGAPVLRLFALGLTLIYVTALASVSLDLIGVQCFPLDGTVCSQLPSIFDALQNLARGPRLALLTLIPLGVMLLLYVISHRARVRFEPNIARLAKPRTGGVPDSGHHDGAPVAPVVPGTTASAPTDRSGATAAPVEPAAADAAGPGASAASVPEPTIVPPPALLASAEFWVQARVAATTERLHFAAVLLFLALLLSGDRLYAGNAELQAGRFDPLEVFATSPIAFLAFVLAATGLALVCVLIVITSESDPDRILVRRRLAGWLLVLSGVLLLFTGLSSAVDPASRLQLPAGTLVVPTVVGLEAAPTLLVGVLLGLSVAALGWRRGVPVWLSIVVLVGALGFLLIGRSLSEDAGPVAPAAAPYYLGAALLLALELLFVLRYPLGANRAERHAAFAYEGWRGMGPGVVMLLALGVAMTLASLVVVGFAAFLAIPLADTATDGLWRAASASPLVVPPAYVEFGVVLLGMLLVVLLFAAATLVPLVTRLYRLSTPALRRDGDRVDDAVVIAPLPDYGASGEPPVAHSIDRVELRVLKARRFAALTQRGEPLLGFLAVTIGVGMAATVVLRFPPATATTSPWLSATPSIAVGILSATALAAVAAIAMNALTRSERPLGLLWDLICFLPRAGHPFGPPCYSDRVVPELNARVRDWLEPDGVPLVRRRVVLSAHSLGAVLAVSTVFAHASATDARRPLAGATDGSPRIGLVTYGTQLRAYFGRFFPELLGPAVLGTRPCRAPRLFGGDPWLRQVLDDENDAGLPAVVAPGTLRAVLTPTRSPAPPFWINVWRRTDFLGFPVNSYRENVIDRGASEIEPTTYLLSIATHGLYPDVAQYDGAIDDLLERMLPPAAAVQPRPAARRRTAVSAPRTPRHRSRGSDTRSAGTDTDTD
ncbi:hypothetical protein D6T64_17605 [Cryobacterium melibiosiphilum]|uniref:Uncharacterized protein n=1 Tax=Cryobacterium melibiosiphilum TaxID=995039 RepID=A0A3A5M942_9MICO|nr:hypothetical protein [Cryobacterium melibiosiphilum]RJT86095.1 hypothetical protein D6T64_17605 [Cryobacterium melibiosiphilum]